MRRALLLLGGALFAAGWAPAAAAAGAPAAPAPSGGHERAPAGGAIDRLASRIASALAARAHPATTRVALQVAAPTPRLRSAAELALAAALQEEGFAPPLAAAAADEAAARGADVLVDVQLALLGSELVAAGELRAVRENFFTGAAAIPAGGALAEQVEADAAVRLLAGTSVGPLAIELSPLASLPEPPLALAAGVLGGREVVAALGAGTLFLLDGAGTAVATYPLPGPTSEARPSRDPRAGLVVAGDRVRYVAPARGRGEVLRLEGGRLVAEATTAAELLPLASGGAGVLAAASHGATNLFGPSLQVADEPGTPGPRAVSLPRPFVAAAAAPGGGAFPFGVVTASGAFVPLDRALAPLAGEVRGIGDAAALADLDGDGVAELVATARTTALPDRVRVHRLDAAADAPVVEREAPALFRTAAALAGPGGDRVFLGGVDEAGTGVLYLLRRGAP